MPDILSDYDRRLIDEAVSRGRITRVPTGASGLPGWRWDGKKLRSEEPNAMRKSINASYRRGPPKSPLITTRRASVVDLVAKGLTVGQIAAKLRVTPQCIAKDLKRLGITAAPAERDYSAIAKKAAATKRARRG